MTIIDRSAASNPQFRRRSPPGAELPSNQPDLAPTPIPPGGYEVGYGKPPKQHRFKPGKSGNPRGRPKGARGVNAMVREILDQKTELTLRGKRRKVPYIQALLLKQLELASKGDLRALGELVKFYRTAVPDREDEVGIVTGGDPVAADAGSDAADPILAAYRAMVLAELAAEQEKTA